MDNNTLIDRYFYGEPGLSIFIEENGQKILFDTGYSDAFLKNAAAMNIDLLDLDHLVLSHGHLDHTWGLDPLIRLYTQANIEKLPDKQPLLTAHPQVFCTRTIEGIGQIGSTLTEEKLAEHFKLQLSKEPIWLTEDLVFLGQIPRLNSFEAHENIGTLHNKENTIPDNIPDDTALACRTDEGMVVITGCSHSGICNITEYAKKVCQREHVLDIIGGFHLLDPSADQLEPTVEYMKQLEPECLHACHCTDLASKIRLAGAARLKEVGVGLRLCF